VTGPDAQTTGLWTTENQIISREVLEPFSSDQTRLVRVDLARVPHQLDLTINSDRSASGPQCLLDLKKWPDAPNPASGHALPLSANRVVSTKIDQTQGQLPVKPTLASGQSAFAFFSISKSATASPLFQLAKHKV
jgi:hypothetical protein